MIRRKFIKGSAIIGMSLANGHIFSSISGLAEVRDQRRIYRILDTDKVNVGTLPVLRAFAGNHIDHVSPYVMLDEFGPVSIAAGSDPLRVDAHPHAGVTPTTYFLDGTGHHKDSLNYDFEIGKGDFMMFSSGRGAIHMEESGQTLAKNGGLYHGFQIWLNTPAKYKFIDPTTSVHREHHMDIIRNEDYELKVVLGHLGDAKSSIETLSPAFYYHVKMNDLSRIDIPTDPTHNVFVYMIDGKVEAEGGRQLKGKQLALYQRGHSDVRLFAECASEFLVLGGQPLNEPVYSYGPFVMNTEDQIKQCIKNYRNGLMGNPDFVNG